MLNFFYKSAKSFPLSLFQDFNLESGLLDGFCINNGSCISILDWVLHTLNRPHCLERVLPDILVNGVTVAKLKECDHKPIEKKHCQRQNGPKALIALTHSTPFTKKLQQVLKSWSNFSFVLLGKGREIHVTTLSHSCNNFNKTT